MSLLSDNDSNFVQEDSGKRELQLASQRLGSFKRRRGLVNIDIKHLPRYLAQEQGRCPLSAMIETRLREVRSEMPTSRVRLSVIGLNMQSAQAREMLRRGELGKARIDSRALWALLTEARRRLTNVTLLDARLSCLEIIRDAGCEVTDAVLKVVIALSVTLQPTYCNLQSPLKIPFGLSFRWILRATLSEGESIENLVRPK
jgi:hypothetical protein